MASKSLENIDCSIAQALSVVGEWWTLMILRNCFHGMRNFDQFQESLGISTSVLSARLKTLVEKGVLEKVQSDSDKRSYQYRLTTMGLEFYPVFVALNELGEKLAPNTKGKRMTLLEKSSGKPIAGVAVLSQEGKRLHPRDVSPVAGPGASQEVHDLLKMKHHRT